MVDLFEKFEYNSEKAVEPTFELMAEGFYTFTVDSIDGDKAVLVNEHGESIWAKIFDQSTITNLLFTFKVENESELVGQTAKLEVKHTTNKEDKTFANVKLMYAIPPVGYHRVRIKSAEPQVSKSGNPMIKLTLEVSGSKSLVYNYVVLGSEGAGNWNLDQVYDSFDKIPSGSKDSSVWEGAVGGAKITHGSYNGQEQANIAYFIDLGKQAELPSWSEPGSGSVSSAPVAAKAPVPAGNPMATPQADGEDDIPY